MRLATHPILGDLSKRREVNIRVDGEPLVAREGDSVAAALVAAGRMVFGFTHKLGQPRGMHCGVGRCCSCLMIVDGVHGVRTCLTPVREGMDVRTPRGATRLWGEDV